MNTRSRSAAKAKEEKVKGEKGVKKKVVESDEDQVEDRSEDEEQGNEEDDNDEDEEPDYQPESKRKAHRKITKKETKPKARKSEPIVQAVKKQPNQEPEQLDEPQADEASVYYELSEKEMKEVNHAFDRNQSNDGEYLLTNGLKTAIRLLGFEPRGDEIQELKKKYATKNGRITRDGFHKIMAEKYYSAPGITNDNNAKDEISRVFNLLDLNKCGFITLENLRSISKELNEELNDEDLEEMIREADTDNDGMIDKEDFQNIMRKTNLY